MKKLMAALLAAVISFSFAYGDVVRAGNTFIQTTTASKAKGQPTKTKFNYKAKDGKNYPIYISQDSGACFIIKVSKKSGKEYRQYLGAEISKQVCKELGLTYKGKK